MNSFIYLNKNVKHQIWLYVIFLIAVRASHGTGLCDQYKTMTNKTPPQMPFLPDSFHVGIEAAILEQQTTVSAVVYFDNPGNRAAITSVKNGQSASIIFNYETDEIYSITGNNCTTSKLSTNTFALWFGWYASNGNLHINTTEDALHFGNKYGEVYIGNTTVRGIPTNHWKSCPNIASWNNVTIDYYFSSNWSTSTTVSSAPIRSEVQGTQTLQNGSVYTIHHIYDFFSYTPDVDDVDDTMFQTPTDTACSGRKQVKPLPTLPKRFYYKTEKIHTDLSAVTFEDVWYDEQFLLFRRDYHPFTPEYPLYNLHPVTEIHDYKTGVRHIIDNSFGNCTTIALSVNQMDTALNITARKFNGSFVIDMKSPLQLFNLDWNYTFIGQTTVRDILCDTYIAVRSDLVIEGFDSKQTTTVTFYFSAQGWTDIYEGDERTSQASFPVKMELLINDIGFRSTYNILDFDPNPPNLNVFDISKCYHEANKITFQMKFPGTVSALAEPVITEWAHLVLAEKMGVAIVRVANLKMDYDDANIFISATLLDKTSFTAQFTKIDGQTMTKQDDTVLYNALSPIQCASFCINNPTFICNSFDFCSNDKSCRLSHLHISVGAVVNSALTCDHYSRNVEGFQPEVSIADAYNRLRASVYTNAFKLQNIGNRVYTAVDVTLTFGWVNPVAKLPVQLSNAYSYSVEVSVPAAQHVYVAKVWYDNGFKMTRYDPHFNKPEFPYYTTNPMSIVEDYNTGLQYVIDKEYRNCTVTQIQSSDMGSILAPSDAANSTYKLLMRNPLQLFRIDNTYFFVGQQTVRGMTCDVFESLRRDYVLGNTTVNAIFRYSFLSSDWVAISDNYLGGLIGQPIRLEITVLQPTVYMEYNIYDFDSDHPDMSVFDVQLCFNAEHTKQIQITFPGNYNDYLNTSSKLFELVASFRMSTLSGASTLRFQQTRLDYDENNLYITTNLVENSDRMLYFTKMAGNNVPDHVDMVLADPQTLQQCATTCYDYSDFICNSFYFCTGSSQCLLSKRHAPDGTGLTQTADCSSYTRTVDGIAAEPSNMIAYLHLQNAVFSGNLTLDIPIPGSEQRKVFIASYIKDVFRENNLHDKKDDAILNFDIHSVSTMVPDSSVLINLDIGSCASACLQGATFGCSGFSYCPYSDMGEGVCVLSENHPDKIDKKQLRSNGNCTTYNRKYGSEYDTLGGTLALPVGDAPFSTSESTNEDCAKLCSNNAECKMFVYCESKKLCVQYFERRFATDGNVTTLSCTINLRPFDKDFQAVNAGIFSFQNIINIVGVTKSDCARYCVQLQDIDCNVFYYSANHSECFITGKQTVVSTSAVQNGVFCNQYQRIFYPVDVDSTANTRNPLTTSVSATSSTMLLTSQSTPTSKPSSGTFSSRSSSAALTNTLVPHSKSIVNTVTKTTIPVQRCSQQQSQTSQNPTNSTGTVVGIAVGTFLLGLLVGAAGLYIFRKLRNMDKDELKTNFVEHEDM